MLKVSLLGSFQVEVDGVLIEDAVWPRRKVKSLLKLLALQPGHWLHKEQVVDFLWPDLDVEAASENLYRNLHLLRRTLSLDATSKTGASLVILKEEILRLNPANGIWVDVEVFQNLIKQARLAPNPVPLLEEAISLYRGDLLEEDPYEEWTILSREELHRFYNQALLGLGAAYRQGKKYNESIAVLQKILAKEPTNESAHRELLLAYTLAGQRTEALNQYRLCTEVISNELGLDPSPETIELYRQILAGEIKADTEQTSPHTPDSNSLLSIKKATPAFPTSEAVLQEPLPYYNNLPAPLTPLVGQNEAILRGARGLRDQGRLLTLTGPGGVGKTRLALEIGRQLAGAKAFAQGVCFVPLASLTDPDLIPLAIAQATGIKEANGLPPLHFLNQKLRSLELLLVLDNFEQVIKGVGCLQELLTNCPGLKILVTSRTVLHLYGEQELVVEPLSLPPARSLFALDVLLQSPAVALFVQRAQAVKADFKLTPQNAPAVSEICFRLDGLPLALELVAAQVKLLPLQQILNGMDDRIQLLNSRARNLPKRQETIQNALDWSYDLLGENEKFLLAQLAVFAQTFTIEAVEAVCVTQPDPHSPTNTGFKANPGPPLLEQLGGLVDKSFLYGQELTLPGLRPHEEARITTGFRMLEVVREYVLEKLKGSGAEEIVRQNHLNYYLALVEEIEPELHRQSMGDLLKRLELEHANLQAALRWSLEKNCEISFRVEKGIRLAAALAWFWHFRGYWSEGSNWLERALILADRHSVTKPVRAKILHSAGILNAGQGQVARALVQVEEGLRLFEELGDRWGIAHSYDWLAELHRSLGHYAKARPLYEAAHEICVELEDHFCANIEQIGLGYISFQQGEYKVAREYLKQSVETSRGLKDRFGAASALNGLGELMRREGDYQHALAYYKQSLALWREMGLMGKVVLSLHNIAQLELDRENFREAESFFKSSLVLSYEIKSKRIVAWCLAGLACTACSQERLEEAARLFGAAEALLKALNTGLDTSNLATYNATKRSLEEKLSDFERDVAWEVGTRAPLEEVVSSVLNHGVFSFDL